VDQAVLAELVRRSQARLERNPDFVELRRKLAERAKRPARVEVAEFLAEREEQLAGSEDSADAQSDPPRPELDEALLVLADLVALTR
jgi:hypothetical protein